MCRRAAGPGLTARVNEVVARIWDSDLTVFLEEPVADYRGWAGERSRHTHDRDLTVSAGGGAQPRGRYAVEDVQGALCGVVGVVGGLGAGEDQGRCCPPGGTGGFLQELVDEPGRHEAVKVVAFGLGCLEGVVQQLAHAKASAKAHDVGSVEEHLRVFADGEPASGNTGGVPADMHPAFVDEPDDHGQDALSCRFWSSSWSLVLVRLRAWCSSAPTCGIPPPLGIRRLRVAPSWKRVRLCSRTGRPGVRTARGSGRR
ncbi:DUF6228 family protein [Streptomyces sp. NPDC002536]